MIIIIVVIIIMWAACVGCIPGPRNVYTHVSDAS